MILFLFKMFMKKYVLILSSVFLLQHGIWSLDFLRPKTVRVDRLDTKCEGISHLVLYFKDVHISLINRSTVISAKVVAEKNLPNQLRLQLLLKRCKSKESLDSCETYQNININRLCDLINSDSTPWAPFVKSSDTPMGCPIKKGVCIIKNGTLDGDAFSAFPASGWFWKVTAKVFDVVTNKLLMCTYFEGQIVPI